MSQVSNTKKKVSQNVKVVVRVRPLNQDEKDRKVKNILNCASDFEIQSKEKVYRFDRVFRPDSLQIDIYKHVIHPMIHDVIEGYNCTVFAYGQTGSGKTHTMVGAHKSTNESNLNWKEDEQAGCIPRAAAHIFDELGLMHIKEYNVRVSFLELYNEEVRDLLIDSDASTPLSLFTDTKGSVYIQNLNESTVCNSNDIYALLEKGTYKRQLASTLMNSHSSRSHTVFTITVHTRETTVSGEEILKTGKLNLVDLAGSENIAKSGAKDKRAQESANINRSLLTLGRVIQALAESSKYVPYRDSKLTRILRDSLGGNTKTCIIATVSPAYSCLDETQNTLEYALRARDIRNTPMVNEKVTKADMMNKLNVEIDKLKRDLEAARTGDGFYVPKESWKKMQEEVERSTSFMDVKNGIIQDLKKQLHDLEVMRDFKEKQYEDAMNVCKSKDEMIAKVKNAYLNQKVILKQEQYVASYYWKKTEEKSIEGRDLIETTKNLSRNSEILQKKLENQYKNNYSKEKIAKEKGLLQMEHTSATMNMLKELKSTLGTSLNLIENDADFIKQKCFEHTQLVSECGKEAQHLVSQNEEDIKKLKRSCDAANQCVDIIQTRLESLTPSDNFSEDKQPLTNLVNQFGASLQNDCSDQVNNYLTGLLKEFSNRKEEKELFLSNLTTFADFVKDDIKFLDSKINSITNWQSSISKVLDSKAKQQGHIQECLVNTSRDLLNTLEGIAENLDVVKQEFNTVSTNVLPSMSESNERLCQVVDETLKLETSLEPDLANRFEQLVTNCHQLNRAFEGHTADCQTHLENIAHLRADIESSLTPLARAGDTPQIKGVTYPKRLGEEVLPRQELIKKFREEYEEDIENQSFNTSMSDVLQLENSDSAD